MMPLVKPIVPLLIVVAAVARCVAANFSFFEPVQPPRRFQVMVHRGEARQAPENSRAALRMCVEDQLEWAEIDLRLTVDGQHVLWHDAAFKDEAGKDWKIKEHSLAELETIDMGSRFAPEFAGERLLSLKDCFAFCKNHLNLYLDCKAINLDQLANEIINARMEQQVVVYARLDQLRRITAVSKGRIATMTKWRPGFGLPDFALTNGLAAVEIDAPDVSSDICAAFHRAGIKVQAKLLGQWDKAEIWERVISSGVDWLQTDLPEEIIAHDLSHRVNHRPVQISFHRGASRYAPENTLPALTKAIRMGADYVEFDVRTTRDGGLFLLHDSRLDNRTDGTGPFNEQTTEAIRKLSAGIKFGKPYASVPLPSLDDFLDEAAGKVGLYFDAKAISAQALADALRRHDAIEQTVVYQGADFLRQLKSIEPRIRALAPLASIEGLDQLNEKVRPYAVDVKWEILSKEVIDRCHQSGIKVFSDAMNGHEKIEEYLRVMDWGIDVIQTDHPLRVMRAIELRIAETKR